MKMRSGAPSLDHPGLRSGLLGAVLCLCALAVWASEHTTTPPAETNAAELQKSLQQIHTRIGQLRQTSQQTGRAQIDQGAAIQRQISGIERQQSQLDMQLHTLGQQNLQQIDALQTAKRQQMTALSLLAGIVVLLLLLLISVWRTRQNHDKKQPAFARATNTTPPPVEPRAPEEPAEPTLQAPPTAPLNETLAESPVNDPTESLLDRPAATQQAPEAEPAPVVQATAEPAPVAPWASLVAADLNSTEQALAQARASFMQPVRIDP